jgi:hypothetical protein
MADVLCSILLYCTVISLIPALGCSISSHRITGRYVKPADKPLSEEDQDYVDVGATKVAKLSMMRTLPL